MKIVFATNNKHKLDEIRSILGSEIEVLSLQDIGCNADIPETGTTLEENAMQKAEYVYNHYHLSCFADDTGLEVDALNGAPGIYSARYAGGEGHDSEANMQKLLKELGENNNRKARFRTVIALIQKKDVCPCGCTSIKEVHRFEGIVEGEITREKSGAEGFGYDPIFRPDGYDKTFAELGMEIKNQISHRARATQKLCEFLLTFLLLFTFLPLHAQVGTWRAYMSYYEPQQIVKAGDYLFVRASNDLYQYNLNDQSITTYDKISGLSDTYITHIAWNQEAKRLIIVYQNSNIDLLTVDGDIFNISSLYTKSMTQDKTVNGIYINGVYAYLYTGFGVVKLNMQRAEISESYILEYNIKNVGISDNNIYIQTAAGSVFIGDVTDNLIDPHNWKYTTNYPSHIFNTDNSDWDNYQELVSTLHPDGPKYNYFNYMHVENGTLLTTGGGWRDGGQFNRPFCVQMLNEGNEWSIIDEATPYNSTRFTDANTIVYDPNDKTHFYVAACGSGLYEFKDNQFVANYTDGNSSLLSAIKDNYNFVRVDGLAFDNNNNLWMSCSSEAYNKDALLQLNTKTGEWKTYNNDELFYNGTILKILRHSLKDNEGYIWMANDHHDHPCLIRINPDDETIVRYDYFVNQDNTSYILNYIRALVQDLDGNLWMGSDQGLFMYDKQQIADPTQGFTQIKVPRNDGTNYADYLMLGIDISAIAVDAANRKWIGTDGNGVYLISADNMEQLQHFTTENSNLLSDNIESIAINDDTGEVFFGTGKGLCSYMSDANTAAIEMVKENVYAYPNPVSSGYDGLITVVGLSFDSDVKIVTTSGQLVAEGRSNGGMFTWDGRNRQGKRVASGIYMVVAATSEGKKGTVCKIAIIH